MSTLVFDIETVGEEWDDLDTTTKKTLRRWIDRTAGSKEEKLARLKDLKEGLGFSALTGKIVAIGLYDVERRQGAVYYVGSGQPDDYFTGDFVFKCCSELEMLQDFWEGARSYDTFVTFNGRGFDVPFMLHRSVAHHIKPSVDLMDGRYLYQQKMTRHVDLHDQLSFYGAVFRRSSLHLYCRAFGIASPKTEVGGDDVAELFRQERFLDIAKYNMLDVIATTTLYKKWYDLLAPESFKLGSLE